jgi:hypothetical protein
MPAPHAQPTHLKNSVLRRARRWSALTAATAAALTLASKESRAANRYWVDTSNNWTANFWSTTQGGAPGASTPNSGDGAYIFFNDTVLRTITYNASPISNLTDVQLDNTGTGSSTIQQSQGLLGTQNEIVGFSGNGAYTLTGGTNNAVSLYVGGGLTAKGTYTLNGNAVLNSTNAFVGYIGNGTFAQSAGTHNASAALIIANSFNGTNAAALGRYNLSGGAVNVGGVGTGLLTVGDEGTGYFSQTGGSVSTYDLSVGRSANGTNSAGAGSYTLSNSTSSLTVRNGAVVGDAGGGIFSQYDGAVTFTQNQDLVTAGLTLGRTAGASGTYALSGGTLTLPDGAYERVGLNGNGLFTQTGGTNTTGTLVVGNFSNGGNKAPGTGQYNLLGGSLKAKTEYVGFDGNGALYQSDGVHVVSSMLIVGYTPAATGMINLIGGTLDAGNFIFAGDDGAATINQTGGTLTVGTGTYLGYGENGADQFPHSGFANYTLSGGTFISPSQSIAYFGTNTSTLTQTGGVNNSTNTINVGDHAGTTGVYNLQNGIINANVINDSLLGNGTFNHSGGTNNAVSLRVGQGPGGVGTYTLSAGALNAGDAANPKDPGFLKGTIVGYAGAGAFLQSGGIHTITQGNSAGLMIGYLPGSSGAYRLDNGTLNVNLDDAQTYVGYQGSGAFTQNGGTHTASFLTTGFHPGGTGTYTLNNGTLTVTGTEYIANAGHGTFVQNGGVHNAPSLLLGYLGNGTNTASNGSYELTQGDLNVAAKEQIGIDGIGSFLQNGGNHTITSTNPGTSFGLTLGFNPRGFGSYTLNLGSLIVNGDENVGYAGAGGFVQNGGGHTVNGTLYVASGAGGVAPSAFALNGGVLNANVLNFGLFTIGTATYNGNFSNSATLNLNGAILGGALTQNPQAVLNATGFNATTGSVTNAGTINVAPGATFSAGNGLNNNGGAINLAGGTVNAAGPIVNSGNITGWGTLAGSGLVTNKGVITQTAGNLVFATTGGAANNGQIALAAGHQLSLSSTLNNNASIDLNGAIVGGSATLFNNPAGVITGPGTIAGGFANVGTILVPAGPLNILLNYASSGTIQLDDFTARLTGGSINNSGTLQGHGTVTSAIANNGTIEAIGGTLTLATGLVNSDLGIFRVSSGAKLLLSQGLASNPGAINLAGGTFDNNGHPLTNSGQITATSGNNIFAGRIGNTATGKIIVSGGASATFVNSITGVSGTEIRVGANSTAVFLGALSGPINFTGVGSKYFEAGVSAPAGPIAAGGITIVEPGAALTADYVQEHSLTVGGNVAFRPNSATSVVNELTLSPGGALDLANTALIVDYTNTSPIVSIRDAIVSHALTSTSLTASTAIGYAEAEDILGATGGAFRGEQADGTSVLTRYTLLGDATLDGAVDFNDLVKLAQNYNTTVSASTESWWSHGDFTYDGITDFNDLVKLAQNYNTAIPTSPIPGASADFSADLARAFASVPEPSGALLTFAACGFALRRRRRVTH